MKRREFLRLSGGLLLGAPLFKRFGNTLGQSESPITIAYHSMASSLVSNDITFRVSSYTPVRWAVNLLIDHTIMALTGKSSVGAAWESLFPAGALTTATKVAIKINLSFSSNDYPGRGVMCPFAGKAVVADAIASGLTQMLGGTFPIENITVFDKGTAPVEAETSKIIMQGFPTTASTTGYDVSGPGIYRTVFVRTSTLPAGLPSFNGGPDNVSALQRILPPLVDLNDSSNKIYWINVSNPKIHETAVYTGVLKNVYGCTNRCDLTHSKIHDCIPYFYPEVEKVSPCILNVMDALVGSSAGSAILGRCFLKNEIAMSVDPLTLEYYGLETVNSDRAGRGESTITTAQAKYLENAQSHTPALGVFSAGARTRADLSSAIGERPMASLDRPQGRISGISSYAGGIRLHGVLDNSKRQHQIESRILDVLGREIRGLRAVSTPASHFTLEWDRKDNRGRTVAGGHYVWQVRINDRQYQEPLKL